MNLATAVICQVWAGISRCHDKIETVQTAFSDGVSSIRMGCRLRIPGRIFLYNRLEAENMVLAGGHK